MAHRYSRGDDSRACARSAHINKLRRSVRNVRGASNYKLSIRPKNVREASEMRPRCVREVSEMQFPCQSCRDRDMRLDHSRRKKLEKSRLRIRFKKCGTNVGRMLTFYPQKTAKKEEKNRKGGKASENTINIRSHLIYKDLCINKIGGTSRARTCDPVIMSHLL